MKVKLPSDSMTQAEFKQQNGDVISYSLRDPRTWAELLALPVNARKYYITHLISRYKATAIMVANMAGVGPRTVRHNCKVWGISFPTNRRTPKQAGPTALGGIPGAWRKRRTTD